MSKAAEVTPKPSLTAKAGTATYSKDSTGSGRLAIISASVSSPLTDGLKFRIVLRGHKHYFKDVRFKCDKVSDVDRSAVIEFFEGRCLENLSRESLAACFGRTPLLSSLQDLIADLQHVLCDR